MYFKLLSYTVYAFQRSVLARIITIKSDSSCECGLAVSASHNKFIRTHLGRGGMEQGGGRRGWRQGIEEGGSSRGGGTFGSSGLLCLHMSMWTCASYQARAGTIDPWWLLRLTQGKVTFPYPKEASTCQNAPTGYCRKAVFAIILLSINVMEGKRSINCSFSVFYHCGTSFFILGVYTTNVSTSCIW